MKSIFQAGGALPVNHPSYVERQADQAAFQTAQTGEYLQTVPQCPMDSFGRRPHDVQLRLGPEGSLYQMETTPPSGLAGHVPLKVKSEEIVLRIWRWGRREH